ncbi:MAG: ribosome-associated translation inhibitor RaiA [Bacteroidetes bacterium]|nr:ribosome-associated translation inhibitor RaiA [Bacteroidota bacterium]
MEVRITSRRFSLGESQKREIEEKVSKLTQYYDGITDTQVILDHSSSSSSSKIAELNVNVFRQTLVSQAEGDTIESAMDAAAERMRRQLMRYKEKLRSKNKDFMR